MSNCTNCFNGCTEIVSDRCVKYTGINIPALGIQNWDTLSAVEESITTYLSSVITGVGVKIDLSSIDICALVQSYLPVCSTCNDISIVDISKALIQAACDLQDQIDAIVVTLTTLNAPYDTDCLGISPNADTHIVLQTVIDKVCELEVDLIALELEVRNQYVPITASPGHPGVNDYIAAYLASIGTSTKYYNRMVPYAVVEYYGPIVGNFDGDGAGILGTNWEKIYLCNGRNGTPDKRGVVGVGTTDGSMLGLTMPSQTNPSSGNPIYSLSSTIVGNNNVTLTVGQLPAHAHPFSTATTAISPNPHTHTITPNNPAFVSTSFLPTPNGSAGFVTVVNAGGPLLAENVTLTAATSVTVASQGGGGAHANFQPGLGCYYIQYRP